jgi:hypothetical protein
VLYSVTVIGPEQCVKMAHLQKRLVVARAHITTVSIIGITPTNQSVIERLAMGFHSGLVLRVLYSCVMPEQRTKTNQATSNKI